jgi:hypothetical protein
MRKSRLGILLILLLVACAVCVQAVAQSFGGAFQRKKIVLVRKLPPTGHIDGSTFAVNVTGSGIPPDVLANLKSTVESLIVSNDSGLRTVGANEHPDAVINCQVTSFSEPPAQVISQPGFSFSKNPVPAQQMTHITGILTATFNAQNLVAKKSIAANMETAKFDQQYPVPPPANASKQTAFTSILSSHIPKMSGSSPNPGQLQDDKPPTPVELRDMLIQNMAFAIVSNLVNTSESVTVNLAIGGGLDEANRLMEQKLWTRALEHLETMPPFPQPDQDAYRIYELGVVNEALGYQAEDFTKARKYLQEASIDYGKAIDAKPDEKNFLQPQTRIDTALAHYKTLGDQVAANAQTAAAAAAAPPAADVLTNADVVAMVAAKLDEANILDTIKTASAVNFDLSAHGQIDLAKGGVNGRIIAAMKQKARPQ